MKQLPHQLVRFFLFTLLAIVLACCLVFLLQLAGGGALSPYLIAVLAALVGAALLAVANRTQGDQGLHRFADTVGRAIDAIMIGAAETSYFVDSVKKKVDLDVQTASDIADSSELSAAKKVARLEGFARVVRGDGSPIGFGRAFLRYLAYFLFVVLTCGIGVLVSGLMVAFTERKQAPHDMVCDTLVVDKWAFTDHPERQQQGLGTVTVVVLVLFGLFLLGILALGLAMVAMIGSMGF